MKNLFITRVYARASHAPASAGAYFFCGTGYDFVPYKEFFAASRTWAECLPSAPIARRLIVLIVAQNPYAALIAFFGALSRGAIPVILPGVKALGGIDAALNTVRHWAGEFGKTCCLAVEQNNPVLSASFASQVFIIPSAPRSDMIRDDLPLTVEGLSDDDIAFLQLTSASTGNSKLVAVSNANICANLEGIRQAVNGGDDERVATWLPLFHDMGLVGTALFSAYHGYSVFVMTPSDFLKKPSRWLQTITDYRCTLTAAPNFGYDYAARYVKDADCAAFDLASLKGMMVGAEPIRHATLAAFATKFSPAGFRPESFVPSYGLAECTLAATMASAFVKPRFIAIDSAGVADQKELLDRSIYELGSEPFGPIDDRKVRVFSVGKPVVGADVTLKNEHGEVISSEGVVGEIFMKGTSVTQGYFRPRDHGIDAHQAGELDTGDLGMLLNGELYILERKKNVIIRNGQNFLANLLEEAVAQTLGASAHNIAVFESDIYDRLSTVIAVVEDCSDEAALRLASLDSLRALDVPLQELLVFKKRVIPRTTSGKKKYHALRQLLSEGALNDPYRISLVTR